MYVRHFFFGSSYLGSHPTRATFSRGFDAWLRPASLLFFCTECGETYCRSPVVVADDPAKPLVLATSQLQDAPGAAPPPLGRLSPFRAVYGCCSNCPAPPFYPHPPGSIWHYAAVEEGFPSSFPDAVMRQEYDRHLKWFDLKGNRNEFSPT